MARWEEVIDHQVDLYKFWRSDIGQQYARGFAESVATAPYLDEESRTQTRRAMVDLAEHAALSLYEAEPVWVDPDMMTLVEAAAASFQPEPLQPNDVISDAGFLWLPRPVVMEDVYGKALSYRAISWKNAVFGTGGSGILLFLYHHKGDPDDYEGEAEEAFEEAVGHFPELTLAHVTPWAFGRDYFAVSQVSSEAAFDVSPEFAAANPAAIRGTKNLSQFIGALFRVMSQTIAVRTQRVPSRQFRKRAKPWLPDKKIVVVTLRRHREAGYPAEPGETTPEWTHRWLVSGHWRNQWFPSLSIHRQVWISPYTKGPEDKPLVIRVHRVFRFAR